MVGLPKGYRKINLVSCATCKWSHHDMAFDDYFCTFDEGDFITSILNICDYYEVIR